MWIRSWRLNKVSHIHWHLANGSIVELLNIVERTLILFSYKVNGYSLTSESTGTSNPADTQSIVIDIWVKYKYMAAPALICLTGCSSLNSDHIYFINPLEDYSHWKEEHLIS